MTSPETARAHFDRTGHRTTETIDGGPWCDEGCGRLDKMAELVMTPEQLAEHALPMRSALLDSLRDTFEPANSLLNIECCRICQSRTLKLPTFSEDGKIAMLKCPSCKYTNMVQVRKR